MRKLSPEEKNKFAICFCEFKINNAVIPYNDKYIAAVEKEVDSNYFTNWTYYLDFKCNEYVEADNIDGFDEWFEKLSDDTIDSKEVAKFNLPNDKIIIEFNDLKNNTYMLAKQITDLGKVFIQQIKGLDKELPLNGLFYWSSHPRACEFIMYITKEDTEDTPKARLKDALYQGNQIYKSICEKLNDYVNEFNINQGKDGVHVRISTSSTSRLNGGKADQIEGPYSNVTVQWEKQVGIDSSLDVFYVNKNVVPDTILDLLFEAVAPLELCAEYSNKSKS